MVTRSLPAFKHMSIGAKTHEPRTATAHVSYIMRSDAMTKFQAENMPDGAYGTRVFFDKLWEKAGMRDNARIADKLMLALPIELSQEQRCEVVQSFMDQLGKGRIPWCAAHHDSGEDAHNPHAHIVFKDADIDTGRKVIGTTTNARDVREAQENGWQVPPRMTTREMRNAWCDHLNRFMEREGLEVRFDARTLKDRGIDRDPGIHIGPKAAALAEKGYDFKSQDVTRREQMGEQTIPYSQLDQGSRIDHNQKIQEANRSRDAGKDGQDPSKSPANHPEAAEKLALREAQQRARQAMYQEQQRDRDALRAAQDAAKLDHQTWARQLYAKARETAYQAIKEQYAEKWEAVRETWNLKARERAASALKREQKKAYAEESKKHVDASRPEKDKAWRALQANQEKERADHREQHRQEAAALARQHIAERLGMHEKWRGKNLDRLASRIDARLTAHQGMAAQQKAALDTIKLHAKASSTKSAGGPVAIPANPHEAMRHYYEIAHGEKEKREAIRATLAATRASHQARASKAGADRQKATSASGRGIGRASPRAVLTPGIRAAKSARSSNQLHLPLDDPQAQIRQAAQSGRTLTDAERANASPELKQQLRREEMKAQARVLFATRDSHQGQRGKEGRSRGGRGR